MSIAVLVATRDRPEQALATLMSFKNTVRRDDTGILFGIDYDEPQRRRYIELLGSFQLFDAGSESGSLTKVTNAMAAHAVAQDYVTIVGSIGDDHRFRTQGWDEFIQAYSNYGPGVYYPNDLFQRENLATAFFADAGIVKALGWLALPVCDHMYIDNAIMDIGRGLQRLHYIREAVVEHLHPAAQKGIMDASYARTNSQKQMDKDRLAYEEWKRTQLPLDIERVKGYYAERTQV